MYRFSWALLFLSISVTTAAGRDDCDDSSDQCVAVGSFNLSLAVGVGKRQNPVVDSDDIPLYLVPQFSYYGERFYVDNLDLGYTVYEGSSSTLSIVASPGYDRVFFYDNDPQNSVIDGASGFPTFGLSMMDDTPRGGQGGKGEEALQQLVAERDRDATYLGGIEWLQDYDGARIQLNVLRELTGEHHGDEIRAAIAFPLVQQQWRLSLTVGATWKSAEIITYYYGAPGIVELDSSISPFVKLGYHRKLGQHWSVLSFVHYQRLGSEMAASPIIEDKNITTTFLGGIYSF